MTTEDTIAADIRSICTDEELADGISLLDEEIAYCQNQRGQVEMELTHRLQGRGARELAHPTLVVKLEYPSPAYDVGKLRALAEVIPPEDYTAAYQPEHTKEVRVPARFDSRQLNVLAGKYGQPVQTVLDQAKLPSTARLTVKAKEVVNHGDNSQLAPA